VDPVPGAMPLSWEFTACWFASSGGAGRHETEQGSALPQGHTTSPAWRPMSLDRPPLNRHWVMSTTTHVSPIFGVPAHLADQAEVLTSVAVSHVVSHLSAGLVSKSVSRGRSDLIMMADEHRVRRGRR
jgi:hypothetical protein